MISLPNRLSMTAVAFGVRPTLENQIEWSDVDWKLVASGFDPRPQDELRESANTDWAAIEWTFAASSDTYRT